VQHVRGTDRGDDETGCGEREQSAPTTHSEIVLRLADPPKAHSPRSQLQRIPLTIAVRGNARAEPRTLPRIRTERTSAF
jgi:hypothetical protein